MSPGLVPIELQVSLYRQITHYFEGLLFSIIQHYYSLLISSSLHVLYKVYLIFSLAF